MDSCIRLAYHILLRHEIRCELGLYPRAASGLPCGVHHQIRSCNIGFDTGFIHFHLTSSIRKPSSRWTLHSLRLFRSGDSIWSPNGSLPSVASSYSPQCKTYLLIRLQTTLVTLNRAVGASIARLVLYIQSVEAYTGETIVDINRRYLDFNLLYSIVIIYQNTPRSSSIGACSSAVLPWLRHAYHQRAISWPTSRCNVFPTACVAICLSRSSDPFGIHWSFLEASIRGIINGLLTVKEIRIRMLRTQAYSIQDT